VLTILVLMASLFPLAMNRVLPARRVDAAARTMWSALRHAQSLSAVSGREVTLTVQGRRVEVPSAQRSWSLPVAAAAPGVAAGADSRMQVAFYPDGTSGGATIELRAGKRVRTVTVSALTGRLAVSEP
jgi:hypothetical protein